MISFGIESTAHTFAIGIVEEEKIIADVRSTIKTEAGKGFLPREIFQHHVKEVENVIAKALEEAKMKIEEIDIISFSKGMGIPNALRVGASVARYLAIKLDKPLIGVNHGIAHIEIGRLLTKCKDPVIVYLSGGNTQIITYINGRYRIVGETEDIAIGNAIDEVARFLGLEMPGGPKIEEIAKRGEKYIEMPYTIKGANMSFSGIVTYVKKLIKSEKYRVEDIIFSFQETNFSIITEATERVLAATNKNEVLLVGGVAANKRLQEMMNIMCEERGAKCFFVPQKYAADNGVMIAYTGLLMYKSGYKEEIESSGIKRNWRIEDIEIKWY